MRLRAELIPTIPAPARVVARNVVWAYGRATSSARPLPDFLIIGAQKAGTTALYAYLREHPAIAGPPWKEVSFFDRHYRRGAAWYRGNFPNRLYLRRVHERERRATGRRRGEPELRLPSTRAGARGRARAGRPPDRSRQEPDRPRALALPPRGRARPRAALVRGCARGRGRPEWRASSSGCATRRYFSHAWWNYTYVSRGLYAEQLERWLELLPARAAARSSRATTSASGPARRTPACSSSSARRRTSSRRTRASSAASTRRWSRDTREALRERFAEPNRRLYELLGRDLGWS